MDSVSKRHLSILSNSIPTPPRGGTLLDFGQPYPRKRICLERSTFIPVAPPWGGNILSLEQPVSRSVEPSTVSHSIPTRPQHGGDVLSLEQSVSRSVEPSIISHSIPTRPQHGGDVLSLEQSVSRSVEPSTVSHFIPTRPQHRGDVLSLEQPVSHSVEPSIISHSIPTRPQQHGGDVLFLEQSVSHSVQPSTVSHSIPTRPQHGGDVLSLEQPVSHSAEPSNVPHSISISPQHGGSRLYLKGPIFEGNLLNPSTLSRSISTLLRIGGDLLRLDQSIFASANSAHLSQQPSIAPPPIISPIQLIQAYEQRREASAVFPPEISDSCVRDCMSRFEDHITGAIAAIEKICGSCGRFIKGQVYRVSKNDPLLLPFYTGSSSSPRLDSCALLENDYLFCRSCSKAIQKRHPPKYSALNEVNVTFCQNYPRILQNLTLAEECLIARSHPIASILKLRPNGAYNPSAYNRVRGHVIVLPQDPGPLLDILPSAEVKLYDKIKVVWFGDRSPTADDLKPYLEVRKQVVYQALQWLRLHNKLYSQIVVNQELLDSWADSFIPSDLQDSVIHSENDHEEHEGYAAELGLENCENDFQEALGDQIDDPVSTGCVYRDVESARQHPTLKLVSAILNLEKDRFQEVPSTGSSSARSNSQYVEDIPVIRYVSNGRSVLMNDWQDSEYFTGSFPTLFPLGSGGHLASSRERPVAVSLNAWAKWALRHHSRR